MCGLLLLHCTCMDTQGCGFRWRLWNISWEVALRVKTSILEVVTRGLLQVRSVGAVLGPGDGEGDEPICSGRNFPSLAFVSFSTLVL